MNASTRFIGFLARRADVDKHICDALLLLRALVAEDEDAQTVIATHGAQVVFKALHKGDGVWLMLCNPAYFVEPMPATARN